VKKNIKQAFDAKIVGVGSCVPEKIVTNDMLAQIVDTDDKWIKKRTGISERHVVENETCTSMGVEATKNALKHAGVEANDVDLIVGTTVTADFFTPSMASLVQRGIGCDHAISFDISAGCTAFVYALSIAASMMQSMNLETAVVVASEVLSNKIDWTDRSTCVLFGDGAGAVVLKKSDISKIKYPLIDAIKDDNDVLYIGSKRTESPWSVNKANDDVGIYMNGNDVFAFATDAMGKTINQLAELMGDVKIDKIIPHQANSRIIRFAANSTDFDKEQFYLNVDIYANTSSATIPIAMREAHDSGWMKKGDHVALVGFGAGLTYGGIVIEWDI
jgi:3-oxoacyl-[acyl-carrier-protein] synthase III